MKRLVLLLIGLALAAPAAAQDPPSLAIRPFVMATEQSFAAIDTATLGRRIYEFAQCVIDSGTKIP